MTNRSKKRQLLGAMFMLLVLIAIIGSRIIITQLNKPAAGVITVSPGTATNTPSFDFTPIHIADAYASFNYPKALIVTRNNPLVNPVIAEYNFTYHDIESWNLAIAVLSTPSGSLATNSAYQFRKSQPTIYKESHQTFNNQSIDIMTDTTAGGFSKVAFLESSNVSATVSLYGDDPAGLTNLSKTFGMILSSWRWQ